MALASKVIAGVEWRQTSALDLSTVYDSASLSYAVDIATGTAINTADYIWHDRRSVTTGANDDIDLTSSTTRSIFGTSVPQVFARVKAIIIKNNATATGEELQIDSSVAASFLGWCVASTTAKAQIGPNSMLVLSNLCDGWAVTATTADIIRITNTGATTISYDIIIIGTSA